MDITFPTSKDRTVQRLAHEWQRLRLDPDVLRRTAGWSLPGTAPHCLDDLLVRSGYGGLVDLDDGDRYLAALVAAGLHDELAARVVLQRLVPGLLAISRRRQALPWHRGTPVFDELLGTAWVVIRTYPLHRRPRRVASGLVRDCEYHQFTRPGRLRSHLLEEPVSPAQVLDELVVDEGSAELEPADELRELVAVARSRGLSDDDVALVASLARGETTAELAARHGLSDRAVRYRRASVLGRLRDAAA